MGVVSGPAAAEDKYVLDHGAGQVRGWKRSKLVEDPGG